MRKRYYEKLPLRLTEEEIEIELEDWQGYNAKVLLDAYKDGNDLVLDIYYANRIVRTVTNEKEFANYNMQTAIWNYKMIDESLTRKDNVIFTLGSEGAVIAHTNARNEAIWTLRMEQSYILSNKREDAKEAHHRKVNRLMKELPPVKASFGKDILNHVYNNEHVLFYNNDTLKGWCCRCATVVKIERGKHNSVKKCPHCKKNVIYKSERMTQQYEPSKEILYIQPIKDGIVLRYYDSILRSELGKTEHYELEEKVRTYHGETIQDYRKRYVKVGYDEWSDTMSKYNLTTYGRKTIVYQGTLKAVRPLSVNQEHLPLEIFAKECTPVPIIEMLRQWTDGSIYERLYKAGFKKLTMDKLRGTLCIISDESKTLNQMLKISKTKAKRLRERDGNTDMLLRLQDAEKNNYGLSEEKIFKIVEAGFKVSELAGMADKQKIMKLYNYILKAEGYNILKIRLKHYKDYINMATQLEYDLSNDVVRYPKNLKEAHDNVAIELNKGQTEKMIAEKLKNFPNIKVMYKELQELYGYQNSQFTISLPRDAGDIILEGRELHHCVGTDSYLNRQNKLESIICFLRKAGKEDKPYYTIELELKTLRVLQYYGANDKKPNQEIVDNWLKEWKQELKKRQKRLESRIEIAI